MTTPYLLPLTNASQSMTIALGGIVYTLTVRWNDDPNAQCWFMTLGDQNGNDIVGPLPLVTGCDLLGQYAYLGIGGKLICQTDYSPNAIPTYDDLGANGNVYFVTEP